MIEYKIEPFLNYPQSERFLLEKHNLFLIFLMLIFLEFDPSSFHPPKQQDNWKRNDNSSTQVFEGTTIVH